jgi:hypothetical protein
MVVFDATMLVLLFSPYPGTPTDSNGVPILEPAERAKFLVASLEKDKTKIIVPTPALAEALVRADAATGQAYIARMKKSAAFRIADFDEKAALEVALMTGSALAAGDKKGGLTAPWNKIKYDRQIVAITLTEGAKIIYSDDAHIEAMATPRGITVRSLGSVQIPMKEVGLFDDFKD